MLLERRLGKLRRDADGQDSTQDCWVKGWCSSPSLLAACGENHFSSTSILLILLATGSKKNDA